MVPAARFRLLAIGLAVWLAVVVGRLVQVSVLQHSRWQAEASRQQEKSIEVEEPRGDIVSRDGRLLASSIERVAIYANPSRIPRSQWRAVADQLAPLTGVPAPEILARFAEKDGFFYLAKDLDPGVSTAVDKLRQRGVGTLRNERRIYPHGSLAGSLLGFVDAQGVGQAGLESTYERTLRGTPSVYRLLRDGKSLPTPLDLRLEKAGRAGLSLGLAVDSRVQALVEVELARTLDAVGARRATAVVMEPATGELLALVSLPSYDPGRPGEVDAKERRNFAVENALEPGSTFKPLIVAAALAEGVLGAKDIVDCSGGGVQIANLFIRDHARYGWLPVRELLAKSSNAGAIRVAMRLSTAQLDGFIRRMGFGRRTGVELPGEASGIYEERLDRWSAVSRASLGVGQEISVSALQLAQAYAVLANGGLLVHPTLVRETHDRDGQAVTPYHAAEPVRVLAPEVAATVAEMLTAVVDEGTAIAAQLPGYRVAGKTGTAQKPVNGSYRAGLHAAWFAGFLPLSNPRLVIVICVDEPRTTFWAADVAVPA
ncbi:MAG: penicillin-binding protein 2, partial [Acidobacteriota bacterium]